MTHLHSKPKVYDFNFPAVLAIVFLIVLMTITSHGHEIETVTVFLELDTMLHANYSIDEALGYCEFFNGIYGYEDNTCAIEVITKGL